MFYETAQTVGPGWHSRSYKPAHYEEMSWSPSTRHHRSPGSSPETYRRIIHDNDDDFPSSRIKDDGDDFFSSRRSPTFPRRIFKEVWNDSSPSNNHHRFTSDRPRMFKRVFRPNQWEDEFDKDVQTARRVERDFDKDFHGGTSRDSFGDDTGRFGGDLKRDIEDEFQKAAGRVHHIPIMVERRMEEMKSKFGKASSPPKSSERAAEDDIEGEEWTGPGVQHLRKTFEPEKEPSMYSRYRAPKADASYKPRAFTSPILNDSWDPHRVHTLPTRRPHRSSQDFDDSRHPAPPKPVFRSYSETHEDLPKPQPHHSAAFRSHSDGHCPNQTYVTKIEVNLPSDKERESMRAKYAQNMSEQSSAAPGQTQEHAEVPISKSRSTKFAGDSSPSMQQINVVLQNVEDLFKWVDAYNGVGRDKQFRFLDEMLTRCMLRLDDVDTEGREDIRSARKAAVRQVQLCIEKLEAKADESERRQKKNPVEKAVEVEDATSSNNHLSDQIESDTSQVSKGTDDDVCDPDVELKLPAVIPLPPARNEVASTPKSEEAIEEAAPNTNDNEQTKL